VHITPSAQKGQKKTCSYFFIAFVMSTVFCSSCQGEQNTMLSSNAIKKYEQVFFWPFWAEAEGVTWAIGIQRVNGQNIDFCGVVCMEGNLLISHRRTTFTA
jgi:hypothetical protein